MLPHDMLHHDMHLRPVHPHQTAGLQVLTPARLDRLQRCTGYPMVSVLLPTTPGARLALEDRKELDHLLDTVETRLALEFAEAESTDFVTPLRDLADGVCHAPARHGLVLYHGAGVLEAYQLTHPPEARVVIDPTFATRDLARDQFENPPYRLLVLASNTARLYIGAGNELTEHTQPPFPIHADDDTPDRRGHLHQPVRTHANPRKRDSFLRTVDEALRTDPTTIALPLVLAAAEPLASRMPARSKQPIVGVVTGNHERTRPTRLAELARPIVSTHIEHQRAEILDELERAANTGRAAFGLTDVWTAAADRRIVRLIVDPTYAQPATTPDPRHVTPAPDPEPPDVLDDAVDEVIEAVARNGGTISFVPLTGAQGHIAAVLRTRQRRSA